MKNIFIIILLTLNSIITRAGDVVPSVVEVPDQIDNRNNSTVAAEESVHGITTEYRYKGHRYMVKVQPVIGPPYYLIDRNGRDDLDLHRGEHKNSDLPQWQLLKW